MPPRCLITPGFVDIHTHYDGQATWDATLQPSSLHGVTTVVMGNCGVGFAPVHDHDHYRLVELMEGVEDIPGAASARASPGTGRRFPQYLDELDGREYAADVAAMIAHGPLRTYVMGQRGADNEPASSDDIAPHGRAGQGGGRRRRRRFSTSRTIGHRAMNGEPVPGTFAAEEELFTIGRALTRAGKGVFEVAPAGLAGEDLVAPKKEIDWICRLADEIGRPVTWLMLQNMVEPDEWQTLMQLSQEAQDAGHRVVPQVAGRPFGVLLGLSTRHRFLETPSFRPLADLPVAEQAAAMGDPDLKAAIIAESIELAEAEREAEPLRYLLGNAYDRQYLLGIRSTTSPAPSRASRPGPRPTASSRSRSSTSASGSGTARPWS